MRPKTISFGLLLAVTLGLFGLLALLTTLLRSPQNPSAPPVQTTSPAPIQSAPGVAPSSADASRIPSSHPARVTDPRMAALLATLLDEKLSYRDRAQAARALAQAGTDQALDAVRLALQNPDSRLKALLAEELGECKHPAARALLLDLANGDDETAARGAIRGFALRADPDAAQLLDDFLFDSAKPISVRTEAALELGNLSQPESLQTLKRAATEITDDTLRENVLEGLGRKPFSDTREFFQEYLQTPGLSTDAKVAALESLRNADGDPSAFLLKYAADPSPDVRAAAAWSLSSIEPVDDLSPALVGLLKTEPEPEVRLRLYQAVANQDLFDVSPVIEMARRETDPDTRLAALSAWAVGCHLISAPDAATQFDQGPVAELKNIALAGENAPNRLAAVMCLGRAGTPGSLSALLAIAQTTPGSQIADAAKTALGVPPTK